MNGLRATVFSLLIAWPLTAAEDALLTAAGMALAGGHPAEAQALLAGHPALTAFGRERLLQARIQLALGDPRSCRSTLGDPAAWSESLRPDVCSLAGAALVALGDDRAALPLLCAARDDAGIKLYAETAWTLGERSAAQQALEMLWRRVPRRGTDAASGRLLARCLAESDPLAARTVLAQVRVLPGLDPEQRRLASEELCALLLPTAPGDCLVVAERELARGGAPGALPLWRAMAMAELDPRDGLQAIAQLSPVLRPLAADAEARCRQAIEQGQQADHAARVRRATALAELGRLDEAAAVVATDAADDPAALAIAVQHGDPARWQSAPAAATPAGAVALAQAFLMQARTAEAWAVIRPQLDHAASLPPLVRMAVWNVARAAAEHEQPTAAKHCDERLRELSLPGAACGEAWARAAQSGDTSAWLRAAQLLPPGHAWLAPAVAAAAHAALSGQADAEAAEAVVLRLGDALDDEPQRRCRFLLVQLLARRGAHAAARNAAESLIPYADATQRARLAVYLASDPGMDADQGGLRPR